MKTNDDIKKNGGVSEENNLEIYSRYAIIKKRNEWDWLDQCYSKHQRRLKMKYVRQFWIILLISAIGEGLHVLVPLPVPASVYGLVIMLIALGTHFIKLEQVKEAAEFLIEIMPVMFIPAGVGLLNAWGVLKPVCVPIILITVITTVVVMVVTGRVTQTVIRMERKKGQKKS